MSALTERMYLELVEVPPEWITESRRLAEAETGRRFPPGRREIDLYIAQGKTPPTD